MSGKGGVFQLFWYTEDKKYRFPLGDFFTPEEAEQALDEIKNNMLNECVTDEGKRNLMAGYWVCMQDQDPLQDGGTPNWSTKF